MLTKKIEWHSHYFHTVSSTMDMAKDLLKQGHTPPFYVLSDQQSFGRGRYERQWQSPKGNLYLTLVTPLKNLESAPFYAYITALSVLDAVRDLLPNIAHSLTLKWPNDILLNSKKTGGILLEIQDDKIIIGIGLNITSHPQDTAFTAIHLCLTKESLSPQDITSAITQQFDKWQGIFEEEGFGPLKFYWLDNRDPKHQQVSIHPNRGEPGECCNNEHQIQGRFHDLDGRGCLIIEEIDSKGIITLTKHSTGDVFFI